MQTTNLRKVGRSVMFVVPPAIVERLYLHAGAAVSLTVADGLLVVERLSRPRYSMAELLAASDYSEPQPPAEREWIDAPAMGRELL